MAMELNTSHTQLEGMPLENSSPTPGWGRQHGAGEVARAPQGCHREPPHRPWPPAELPSTSAALDQSFSFLASSWSQSCSPSLPAWMLSPLTGTQHYPSPSSLFSWDFFLLHGRDWSYPTISQNHKIFYRETFFFPCSEQDRVKNKNVPDLHSAQVLLTIEERRGRRGRLLHALLTALSLLPRLQHNPGYWVPCDEEPALLQQFIYFLITLSTN